MTMNQLDKSSFLNDINISLRVCMITGCIIMESISIMENLTKLGIKFPGIIENILAVKKESSERLNLRILFDLLYIKILFIFRIF